MALVLPPATYHFLDKFFFSCPGCCRMSSIKASIEHCWNMRVNGCPSHRLNSARVSLVENVAFQLQFLHRRSVPYKLYGGLRTDLNFAIAPSPPTTTSWSLRLFSRSARARRRLALSVLPSPRSARLYVYSLLSSPSIMMHNIHTSTRHFVSMSLMLTFFRV
jgi:hypothetical protein